MPSVRFPFTAIIGQQEAKAALIYGLINPRIGGVLLCGQKGCAKTTMVRAMNNLAIGTNVIDMPLNVTEDMLLGSVDFRRAVKAGERAFSSGLLARAHGHVLYVDEVNLLSDTIINSLLDVAQSGVNRVEREGISQIHASEFLLVGSMNPEEASLRSGFLDRFGLYVQMKGMVSSEERKQIVRQRIEFEKNPVSFAQRYITWEDSLSHRITDAKSRLASISVEDDVVEYAAELANLANAAGHRAEIIMIETALAVTAYNERDTVSREDIEEAARFVLPHRMQNEHRDHNVSDQPMEGQYDRTNEKPKSQEQDGDPQMSASIQPDSNGQQEMQFRQDERADDSVVAGNEVYAVTNIGTKRKDRNKRKGSGRRSKTVSGTSKGRYIGYNQPINDIKDIALDATLRAAAPYQMRRVCTDTALNIQKSDIRIKKREHHAGTTILFAVDASGSMGAQRRMRETKNAVLSLLFDAYQKRDKVGMIAFRKKSAEVLLPFTRSVELAQKRLQMLPTGGRTPIAQGLLLAWQMIKSQQSKDKDMIPLLVLITDGRANDERTGDPFEEAMSAADAMANMHLQCVVIDTEKGPIKLGLAAQISQRMNAQYIKVEELKSHTVENAVRSVIKTMHNS